MHTFKYSYAIRIPLIVGELEKKIKLTITTITLGMMGSFLKKCIPIQNISPLLTLITLIPSHPSKFTQIRKTKK
jgi:hypothetical protein